MLLDHGQPADASYAYRVEPGAEAGSFFGETSTPPTRPTPAFVNTPACQAVLFEAGSAGGRATLQAVLHGAGEHRLPGGSTVQVDGPALLMLRAAGGPGDAGPELFVASPYADRRKVESVELTLTHPGGSAFPEGGYGFNVDLPQRFHAGQTVRVAYPAD